MVRKHAITSKATTTTTKTLIHQFYTRKVGGSIICLFRFVCFFLFFFFSAQAVCSSFTSAIVGHSVSVECWFRLENVSMMCGCFGRCCCGCFCCSYILVIICKPSMPHLTLSFYVHRNIKTAHETRMIIKSKLISAYLFFSLLFLARFIFCAIYEWFRDFKMWFLRLKSGHKERKETELYHIIKWW